MRGMPTHETTNAVPPFGGLDLFAGDTALRAAVEREGAGWVVPDLERLGPQLGSSEWLQRGRDANR